MSMKVVKKPLVMAVLVFGLFSCSTIPKGIEAVSNFEKDRYLGKWYEIARFDFRFEKDLINTTAEYSVNPNGTIRVVNRGYNTVKEKWSQVEGKAKFVGKENVAMLKVSFFGPFYGGYNVIALDENYQYALVSGGSREYLWILSRKKTIPEDVRQSFLQKAESLGFRTADLLWVKQE